MKEELEVVALEEDMLYCSVERFDGTKTSIDNNGNVLWCSGDQIAAFINNTLPQKYQIQEGYVGYTAGEFSKVNESGDEEDMLTSQDIDHNVLVYPFSSDVWCKKADNNTPTQSYGIDIILPSSQQYSENSFGNGAFPMVAVSTTNQFALKNINGAIKLQIKGNAKIKSITLKGGNNELLSGGAHVTCYADGSAPEIEMCNSALKEVTLDCGDGVQLTEETATTFILSLPPVDFTNGFTITLTDTQNNEETITATKSNSVLRSLLLVMPVITSSLGSENNGQPANEIWYTSTAEVQPYRSDVFGANILSNVWDETTKKGVITFDGQVSKIGYMAFYNRSGLTSICIPNSVNTIENSAFSYCENLISIELPNSITTIEKSVFKNCYNLSAVTIPNRITSISEDLFFNCKNLEQIIFPNSVSTIEKSAFQYCNNLTNISIPNGVTTIGDYAFSGCKSLALVSIPDGVISIGAEAFAYCDNLSQIAIGNNVTTIGIGAFRECINLTDLTIPNSVSTIGASSLWGCTNLSSITLSNNITEIGDYLFYKCNNLTTVTIPANVTSIGKESFRYCSNLTKITIPESVVSIGDYAFRNCDRLNKIYSMPIIPPSRGNYAFDTNRLDCEIYVYEESVDAYKSAWSNYANIIYANGNCPAGTLTYIYYTTTDGQIVSSDKLAIKSNTYNNGQGKMVLYDELKLIPDNAFYNCDKLISITIPDCVKMIGRGAFEGCGSLSSVNFGNGITVISGSAFYNCCNLTSITLPDSVREIGSYAFAKCDKLEYAALGKGITYMEQYVFNGCDRLEEFRGELASGDGRRCLVIEGILYSFAPYGITEYTIPNNVTTIDWYAFSLIGSLTAITISESVTDIGNGAFNGCSNLTTVTISDKIKYIGAYAFNNCSKLKNVYCKATEPPRLDEAVFYNNASGRKIYVPYESVDKYKDSYANNGWNDYEYFNAITGYNF